MKAVLHPRVHSDLVEAMEFYEREGGSKLAADFFGEAEKAIAAVCKRPQSFPVKIDLYRSASIGSFPFHLLFTIEPSHIFVLVVRHDKRHPDFGLDR